MVIAVCNIICIPQIKWKLKLVSGQIISKTFVDFIIIVGKKYPNRIMLPNTLIFMEDQYFDYYSF